MVAHRRVEAKRMLGEDRIGVAVLAGVRSLRAVTTVILVAGSITVATVSAGATVSGEDGRIAFIRSVGGVDQIFTVAPNGSDEHQVTHFDESAEDPTGIGSLSWSPDGTALAFSTGSSWAGPGPSIWTIGVDGDHLDFVAMGSDPSWSPDGRSLVFSRGAVGATNGLPTSVIVTVDLDTGVETILTDPGDWVDFTGTRTTEDYSPVWSPDGTKVVYRQYIPGSASYRNEAILELSLASGETRLLVSGGGVGGPGFMAIDTSPSGDAVSYVAGFSYAVPFGSISEYDLDTETTISVHGPDDLGATGVGYAPSGQGFVGEFVDWVTPDFSPRIWRSDGSGDWVELGPGREPAWQPVNPYQVGLVDPSQGEWQLRHPSGVVEWFYFGNPGDMPFMGDWDCDGIDTPGLYRQSDGFVYLRNSNDQGVADWEFFFGNPGDVPIAGDFNNDGCDTVSLYRPSQQRFYIINALGENGGGLGAADFWTALGNPGDTPFSGDFDGDGFDEIGLHRAATGLVYYEDELTVNGGGGQADQEFFFGNGGDRFVAGDWTGDGTDTIGVYRPSNTTFYFRFSNTQGTADARFIWGEPGWIPVSGTFSAMG